MQPEFEDFEDLKGETGLVDNDGKPVPPDRLSHSGASTFEQCPKRWRFRYVERLPDLPGPPALVGTFSHKVLELLLQRPPDKRTTDQARKIAKAEWSTFSHRDEYTALELDKAEQANFKKQAWKAIEGLWTLEDPEYVDVYSTEEQINATLGIVPFRGVVDRIDQTDDGLVVTDYKSGRAPSQRFANERLYQVLLYSAAVADKQGELPVRACLYYLGQRVVETDVSEEGIDEATARLETTWTDIGTACSDNTFEARPGKVCKYCSFLEHCSEGTAQVEYDKAEREAEDAHLESLASFKPR